MTSKKIYDEKRIQPKIVSYEILFDTLPTMSGCRGSAGSSQVVRIVRCCSFSTAAASSIRKVSEVGQMSTILSMGETMSI